MKAFRSRLLAFLMMGVVFTFSTGMGLVEHKCLVSGQKTVSTAKHRSCCAKKAKQTLPSQQTTVKKDKCCEMQAKYLYVDFASLSEKVVHAFANVFFVVTDKTVYTFRALLHRSETAQFYTNSSPPKSGRTLLIQHHTLLI